MPAREVFVSPVVVVSHAFPARPGSIPDAEQFVREALDPVTLEPEENRALYDAITTALLAAAGPKDGVFDVTVRIFPDGVEVEVLHGAGVRRVQPAVGAVRRLAERGPARSGTVPAGGRAADRGVGADHQPVAARRHRTAVAGPPQGARDLRSVIWRASGSGFSVRIIR